MIYLALFIVYGVMIPEEINRQNHFENHMVKVCHVENVINKSEGEK